MVDQAWYYNNIRITITGITEDGESILPRLQPLNTSTVTQFFGNTKPIWNVQFYVVGYLDKESLLALRDGTAYTLSGYGSVQGNFKLNSMQVEWTQSYRQTFRTDKPDTDSVYRTTLELYKE